MGDLGRIGGRIEKAATSPNQRMFGARGAWEHGDPNARKKQGCLERISFTADQLCDRIGATIECPHFSALLSVGRTHLADDPYD